MTGRVVVGVDGSETAADAAATAGRLAQALGAELHVLSAYGKVDVHRIQAEGQEFVVSPREDAANYAEQAAGELRRMIPDLQVHTAPVEGKPAEALVEAATSLEADVIVVGNKRVQGIARVLGSIATDVAQQAPCDVYIAHTHRR